MKPTPGEVAAPGRIALIRPGLRQFLKEPFDHARGASMYGVQLDDMNRDELIGCCVVMAMQQRQLAERLGIEEEARAKARFS